MSGWPRRADPEDAGERACTAAGVYRHSDGTRESRARSSGGDDFDIGTRGVALEYNAVSPVA
jgi:hypothetical protein